ncbi:immunity 49 family protein [Kitasatospora sp. NPDC051853]|uniref:immunity 49 family protein n=1 Tax=Kitasatospora sp. NPDC051853 TaxID=3364058 RepID=UPI0037912E5E
MARHEVPTGNAERGLEVLGRSLSRALAVVDAGPRELARVGQVALTVAESRGLLDPTARQLETWDAYVLAMHARTALFAVATSEVSPVECRFGEETRLIAATGPQSAADAGTWVEAFWLSVICREPARLDMLCAVPIEVLRASGAVYDEYVYSWVETLQAYWRKDSVVVEKLTAAIEGTDPEVLRVGKPESVLSLIYPPMAVLYQLLRGDGEKFNAALVEAVELHRDFWSEEDDDRAITSTGFVALGPLAVACMAYDGGVPIEIESEYLPKNLLERSWVGDYPTA